MVQGRMQCQYCGKMFKEGEEVLLTKLSSNPNWYYKYMIHTEHIKPEVLKKWKSEDVIDAL